MDLSKIQTRIDSLLSLAMDETTELVIKCSELLQGTLTVMISIYGPESTQVTTLRKIADQAYSKKERHLSINLQRDLVPVIRGTLQNLKIEIDQGILGSLQKKVESDVLTDFIQLAKVVLDEGGDNSNNVAAVLVAAAFEDTIRRMGQEFAGIIGRDKLEDVITQLKKKGILVAPQLGIAIGYLNFRNHALHADWDKIERSSILSAVGFVEELLLKHFQ